MEDAEEQIKIVFVGDSGVGKTSILNYYHRIIRDTVPTIGASHLDILVDINGKKTNLNIWDTAGQFQFRNLMPIYLRDSCVVVICFSVDLPESFDSISGWNELITDAAPENAVKLIVCNKIDLEKEPMQKNVLTQLQSQASQVFHTSAVTGQGIDSIFEYIKNDENIPRDSTFVPQKRKPKDEIPINTESNDKSQSTCC